MNCRSMHDMNEVLLNRLHKVPADVEVIVGVPRSGMLAALMLALHRNAAITDVDGLLESRVMPGGSRTHAASRVGDDYLKSKRKVLVIDDSYCRGGTIRQVKERIRAANLPHEILYAAVYGGLRAKGDIDIVFESLLPPHVFEWNLARNSVLPDACLDMDGVLCRNPQPIEDDDGERYKTFMDNAELLWMPDRRVGWIVTSRLEKYRATTADWLKKHGIEYRHLIMLDVESQLKRREISVPKYKAGAFRSTGASLFIESSLAEALEIASLTGLSVFCFERAEFMPASRYAELKRQLKKPSDLFDPLFRYAGYVFRKYPDHHPVVGLMRKVGRKIFRSMKQMGHTG